MDSAVRVQILKEVVGVSLRAYSFESIIFPAKGKNPSSNVPNVLDCDIVVS